MQPPVYAPPDGCLPSPYGRSTPGWGTSLFKIKHYQGLDAGCKNGQTYANYGEGKLMSLFQPCGY